MNDAAFGCADVEGLAAELALGIVSGAERAAALEHLSTCSACRARVDELAEVADELLLLGPEREPPAGFESRVLGAMGMTGGAGGAGGPGGAVTTLTPPRPRRFSGRMLALAAAVLIIVGAIGAFIGNWAAPGQSRLTKQYLQALSAMGGSALGAEKLQTATGQDAGEVFVYEGKPSWLFVSVWDTSADNYTVRLIMKGGTPVTVAALQKIGDSNSLGADVDVDVTMLERVEIIDPHGAVRYQASFTLLWPKWSASGP